MKPFSFDVPLKYSTRNFRGETPRPEVTFDVIPIIQTRESFGFESTDSRFRG